MMIVTYTYYQVDQQSVSKYICDNDTIPKLPFKKVSQLR